MGRLVITLALLANAAASALHVHAATLPNSLSTGVAGIVEARHEALLFDVYRDASADAAAAHPEHADKLSAFAGFIGRQMAEQNNARTRVLSGVQALLNISEDVDRLANEVQAARGVLARLERKQISASGESEANKRRHRRWVATRASLVRELDTLERQHEGVRSAASRYGALATLVEAGEHDLQRRSARSLARFNRALSRHRARLRDERAAQTAAVADFEDWYRAQKTALGEIQQRIDAAHHEWSAARAAATAALTQAKRLAEAYDAASSPGIAEQSAALSAKETYQTKLSTERTARTKLLALQAQGTALLEETLGERKAREQVLAQAREAMASRHAELVAEIEADRASTQAEVAANGRQLKAEVDAAASAVKLAERNVVDRYGRDYLALHQALVSWLASNDATVLDALAKQTTPLARQLVADARVSAAARRALGFDGNAKVSKDVATSTSNLRSLRARYDALGSQFRAGVNALQAEQADLRVVLTAHRDARHTRLRELLGETPGLEDWGHSLKAAIALLETEFRYVMSALGPADAAPGIERARWQRARVELRRVAIKYPHLRRHFDTDSAVLLVPKNGQRKAVSSLARNVAPSVLHAAALTPLVDQPQHLRRFAEGLAEEALGAWSRPDTQGMWRFLEGRFRYSNQRGFERYE